MKPLFVALKTIYFEQFKDGSKKTEYRLYGDRWNEKHVFPGRRVTLSKGYTRQRIHGTVVRLRKIKNRGITDIYPQFAVLAAIDITLD